MDYARLSDGAADAVGDVLAGRARGLAVDTSGSTGTPSEVLLSTAALRASATATLTHLGGDGHWLLALPTERIAGAMVVMRAALSGMALTTVAPGPFTARSFVEAAQQLPAQGRHYVSLVPTQMHRVLADAEGRAALAAFDAVLVGGAAWSPSPLVARAQASAQVKVVRTYGMTETAGGCVYDGVPIGDTQVRLREDGRICLASASLADAYRPERADAWEHADGRRWLVTADMGQWDEQGRLQVLGRVDEVITSGGMKVHPRPVEQAINSLLWVGESAVVGVPDAEWGSKVVAFVVPIERTNTQRLSQVREALREALPAYALPRELVVVEGLPRQPSGKVDYSKLRGIAADLGRTA